MAASHLFSLGPTLAALAALAACSTAQAPPAQAQSAEPPSDIVCYAGAYQLSRDTHLVLSPTADRQGNLRGLRALFIENGAQGVVARSEGGWAVRMPTPAGEQQLWPITFGACDATSAAIRYPDGRAVTAQRLAVRTTETSFQSQGVTLHGALIMPPSGRADQIVVQVHGSGDRATLPFARWRYIWPAQNIGVFIYDKRGTGRSQGRYTVDFPTLAADAAAAITHVRAMPQAGRAEIGFFGTSQGGWIAPLAAMNARPDFMLIGYGAAYGPMREDREEVFRNLRAAGYGDDVLAQAREITDATGLGMSTGFERGTAEIAAVKARYGREPWFSAIRGEYSGDVLAAPTDQLRSIFLQRNDGTSWGYDPMPALRAMSNTPAFWVLGGEDEDAPSAPTLEVLNGMRAELPRLQIAVFPNAGHEIEEFANVNGQRVEIGYSRGYLPMLATWMRTKRVDTRGTNAAVR